MRQRLREWRRCFGAEVAAGLCLLLLPVAGWGRGPEPMLRLPLEPMDFQPLPATVLNAGVAAMTLHYVDGTHLLLTFSRRRLLPRLADAQPGDFDRNVDAVLLELPSGKVLARTSWRLRDASQYLWTLGDGEFLLRERNRLTILDPLRGLKEGDAFAQHAFLASERPIGAVLLSPSGDLLTLETLDHSPEAGNASPSPGTRAYAAAQTAASGDQAAEASESVNPVQIDIFRLESKGAAGALQPVRAGAISSQRMVLLPLDGSGLLTMLDQGKGHWAFDFHRHGGKVDELSPFDSSCRPLPFMVSRSEFIAFGCRGGVDRRSIGGFNLRGEEMWEQMFTESYTRPELSLAPAGGRFALGRMITGTPMDNSGLLSTNQVSAESVTVYQTESGRALLSLNLTPVLLAGENFAISPDGSSLAALNNGAIEVYALPAPSGKERKAMELAESLVPERTNGPVNLDAIRAPSVVAAAAPEPAPVKEKARARAADTVADAGVAAAEASTPSATGGNSGQVTAPAGVTPTVVVNGDPEMGSEERRKPPTLYGPEEKPGSTETNGHS